MPGVPSSCPFPRAPPDTAVPLPEGTAQEVEDLVHRGAQRGRVRVLGDGKAGVEEGAAQNRVGGRRTTREPLAAAPPGAAVAHQQGGRRGQHLVRDGKLLMAVVGIGQIVQQVGERGGG